MKTTLLTLRLGVSLAIFADGVASGDLATERVPVDRMPTAGEMSQIRQEVETLRAKKFLREVPARSITEAELRAIVDREMTKAYPGRKLADLEELMIWLDFLPPETDLPAVCANLMVDQVAGLYDSETKTMCLPSFQGTNQPVTKKHKHPSEQKLETVSGPEVGIVFAHEYTHALEDQYWPIEDPTDKYGESSTDRDDAQSFLFEGSATRLMVEALPAESERLQPGSYVLMWNLLHSGMGEGVMDILLSQMWKSAEAKVPGVPETLARSQVMPYSFGYTFCRRIQSEWGLDGLDYVFDHRPVSTEQVMHPEKCWEWRDFPATVTLPETLPGGWKKLIDDTFGEAGTAVLLGCQLKNLNRGEWLARGWDGDRVGLYAGPGGKRLVAWASAWDSESAAERFSRAWLKERRSVHHVAVKTTRDKVESWTCADGRVGMVRCTGQQVLIFESNLPEALDNHATWMRDITFAQPPQDAERAAVNRAWLRHNPIVSWRKDGDYAVTKAFCGFLWRRDHNSIGVADRALLGLLGNRHRTTSLNQWRLGWGLIAKHHTEARRGVTKTTLLPWGALWSRFSTALPQSPTNTISRTSALWGLAVADSLDAQGRETFTVLPAGLLFRTRTGANEVAWHFLATGFTRQRTSENAKATTKARILGIPVCTWRSGRN